MRAQVAKKETTIDQQNRQPRGNWKVEKGPTVVGLNVVTTPGF